MHALLPFLSFYKRHKWMITLSIVLAIVTLLANIGLLTLSGWFLSTSAVVGVTGLYNFNYMLPAAGVRSFAIIRTAGRYFERLVSHDVTFRILQHLRVFIFSRLIPLSPGELACFRHGELLNCVVADVGTLDHLYLRVVSPLISAFMVIVVVTLGLGILDITLAIVLGNIMLFILFLLPPIFYRAGKPVGKDITRLRGEYRKQLTTWLQCQAEIALFGANRHYRVQMDNIELNWHKAQRKHFELISISQTLITLISGITMLVMLWMVSKNVRDDFHSSTLIAIFVFCTLAAFEALAPAINSFQYLGQVIASALRVTQLIEQIPKVQFSEKYVQSPVHVELCIQNVTFFYDRQMQPALRDLTLNVLAGEQIAIIGRTGCGKSTLLQLITRTWDPCQGAININAIPITDFSEMALRRTISIVTQRVHLFSATLRDNLLLAAPDADDIRFSIMLERVGLQKLLEGEGLDSWLGEGGRQLSGGELRRLAIARALLHDAPLILLDEPMEGLDASTENQMLDLFKQVMKGKTVLMVTHRLHGLANFDRIIVMDNGQIIEQGNHAELVAKHGRYYQLRQCLWSM